MKHTPSDQHVRQVTESETPQRFEAWVTVQERTFRWGHRVMAVVLTESEIEAMA